jgi:hypothetical protein
MRNKSLEHTINDYANYWLLPIFSMLRHPKDVIISNSMTFEYR